MSDTRMIADEILKRLDLIGEKAQGTVWPLLVQQTMARGIVGMSGGGLLLVVAGVIFLLGLFRARKSYDDELGAVLVASGVICFIVGALVSLSGLVAYVSPDLSLLRSLMQ